jgi:hypothetical protein
VTLCTWALVLLVMGILGCSPPPLEQRIGGWTLMREPHWETKRVSDLGLKLRSKDPTFRAEKTTAGFVEASPRTEDVLKDFEEYQREVGYRILYKLVSEREGTPYITYMIQWKDEEPLIILILIAPEVMSITTDRPSLPYVERLLLPRLKYQGSNQPKP